MNTPGRRRASNERGSALIEFAVTAPILIILVVGLMRFGLAYNNSIILTDAVRAGARQLSISRGVTTPSDICATAGAKVRAAAITLAASSITMSMVVNGITSAPAAGALPACNNAGATMVVGADVTVSASYPCSLRVFGINFGPGTCTLNASTTARVE